MIDPHAARAHLADTLLRTGAEDRTAFRELYRLTNAKLFGICLRICGERSAAEDVLHEVYLLVWKRAGGWEPGRASPISWLATVARNRAIDWRRAQGIRTTVTLDEAGAFADGLIDGDADPETLAIDADERRRLLDCLNALDARSRAAIRTAFFEGATYAELAERAAVPLGTLKSWIRRGLHRLQECLGHD